MTTMTRSPSYMPAAADLLGRVGLAAIFLLAGLSKIGAYDANAAYMASVGVPAALLPFTIALEVGGALAIILGFQTRLAALALAGFSVVTAVLFHNQLGDQIQFIMFWKNIGLAGGFLLLAVHGPGAWSLDAKAPR